MHAREGGCRARAGGWLRLGACLALIGLAGCSGSSEPPLRFQRVASFPAHRNAQPEAQASARAVAAFDQGRQLVYTDPRGRGLGFVNIREPRQPRPGGRLLLGGKPRSLAVAGAWALVTVETRRRGEAAGLLVVVDLGRRQVVHSLELAGRPDAVTVGPTGRYAALVVKGELGRGGAPRPPGGFLVILDLAGEPREWRVRRLGLQGVAERFPEAPQPESVAIGEGGLAAITLQANNHVVLVDLERAQVLGHWNAGHVDLDGIDTRADGRISLDGSLHDVPREPSGIAWLPSGRLATADEGALEGGGRGFTIFDRQGRPRFRAGPLLEHLAVRHGHYPEWRSERRGVEPNSVHSARFEGRDLLFVGAERAAFVGVFELRRFRAPRFLQLLPTGVDPRGLLALPARNLFVVASQADEAGGGLRAGLSLYALEPGPAHYPSLVSEPAADGRPRAWGALSGLTVDPKLADRAYAVGDAGAGDPRILVLDLAAVPARIVEAMAIQDPAAPGKALDLDPEGLAARVGGGFWLVSEGDTGPGNRLLALDSQGKLQEQVALPASVQRRVGARGFEGVAVLGSGQAEQVFVAFQAPWRGDPHDRGRIGRYEPGPRRWRFFAYPLDRPASAAAGQVGLSGLAALDASTLAVIERDAGAGDAAAIKRVQAFSVSAQAPVAASEEPPLLRKRLLRDLLPALTAHGRPALAKPEGLAVTRRGELLVVTDNDAGRDSSPETRLLRLALPPAP